ncbi:MAG TPA: DNA-binding protein [Duganella sp.]|jgi:hypothetical protein
MARTGLDKSDVKKARDGILARSLYPSVDAVRIALGNTGSKTTIHKYLKELEAEEGGGPHKSTVSEALHDLVERLAARLEEEADERVVQAELEFARKEHACAETCRQLEAELIAERASTQTLERRLQTEVDEHAKTRAALQAETVARHTAAQEVAGLKDRLAENEQHRKSLEDKHIHARNALEQYRLSVKEQRGKDQRRHEHQVEQLKAEVRQQQLAVGAKQEEMTKLNQEGARVVMELSHTKQSLYEQLTNGRKLEQKIEQLQSAHMHAGDIERQLVSKIAEAELLAEQLKNTSAQLEPAKARAREFELLLAQTNAKVEAQEQIGEQLRAYLEKLAPGVAAKRAR